MLLPKKSEFDPKGHLSVSLDVRTDLIYLEASRRNEVKEMSAVKISSKIDEKVWDELKSLAGETHQNVSGLLTEAVKEYVQRRRVRPVVLKHLENSMEENKELGYLLAR
jgi:predicted transcriptional regulator